MRQVAGPERIYSIWKSGEAVILDCRFVLSQPLTGYEAYAKEHIPGAFYLDLEKDLSSPKLESGSGGRHPLPDFEVLAKKLSRFGLTRGNKVIAYDEQGGAMASRLWWLLSYMGHDEIFIMNGGFQAWKQAGYPTESGENVVPEKEHVEGDRAFKPDFRKNWLVSAEDIESRKAEIAEGKVILLDSREEARYRGMTEPLDRVAGHIPGARHSFWKANMDAEGRVRPVKEQMQRFESLQGAEEIIVYCGSGVTACSNVLALREIGFTNVKLYAGSWSDWISDPARPIEVG